MPCVLDLDDNLLNEILSYYVDDKPTLCRVARTSRHFSAVVRPLLFRHVGEINPNADDHFRNMSREVCASTEPTERWNGKWETSRFSLVKQSIVLRPSVALLIRSISLFWYRSDEISNQTANILLRKLTQLRSLSVQTNFDNPKSDSVPFQPDFLAINPMDFLSELQFNDGLLSVSDFTKLLSLSRLQYLSVPHLKQFEIPSKLLDYQLYPGMSPVLELQLGPHFHVPLSILKAILKRTPALQKLSCRVPGQGKEWAGGALEYEMKGQLSPSIITDPLAPIINSLVELDISGGAEKWPSHDGSRLDLSKFIALKKARIASRLFFKSRCCPENPEEVAMREGLYKLLPFSLEELTISFEYNSDFISLSVLPRTEQDLKANPIPPWKYGWCTEIHLKKATHFPRLFSLAIVEEIGHRLGETQVPLRMPFEMRNPFEIRNVAFSVLCRFRKRDHYRPRKCPVRRPLNAVFPVPAAQQ